MYWSNYRLIQVLLQLFLWVFKIEGGLRTDSTFGIEFNYFYTPDNYIVSNSNPLKTSFDEIKSQKNVLDFGTLGVTVTLLYFSEEKHEK